MNRDDAWNLLCEFTQTESLRKHALAVEFAMRAYARRYGEDEELWGVVGLVHDFDYEQNPTIPNTPPWAPRSCASAAGRKRLSPRCFRTRIIPASRARRRCKRRWPPWTS